MKCALLILRTNFEFVKLFLRRSRRRDVQLVGAFDDFVVDAGEVHHEAHLIAAIAQIAVKQIEDDKWPAVVDVKIIIHCRPA